MLTPFVCFDKIIRNDSAWLQRRKLKKKMDEKSINQIKNFSCFPSFANTTRIKTIMKFKEVWEFSAFLYKNFTILFRYMLVELSKVAEFFFLCRDGKIHSWKIAIELCIFSIQILNFNLSLGPLLRSSSGPSSRCLSPVSVAWSVLRVFLLRPPGWVANQSQGYL